MAVLAEKPSVARDIAKVLGADSKGDGYLHGNGYVVTWAIGHLAALAQPHGMRPEGVTWPMSLPVAPGTVKLVIIVRDTNSGRVGSLTVSVAGN